MKTANSNDLLTRIGEQFGGAVMELIRGLRVYTVSVVSVDDEQNVAHVKFFPTDAPFPVPLTLLNAPAGMLTVRPAIDSTAVISFMNGDENAPFFVAVSEVDEVKWVVGESTIRITDGLIELNGGTLGDLVVIGKLTERLNKMQSEINQIQNAIASHKHTYIDSVGQAATPVTKNTLTNTYSKVTLTDVKDEDYNNEKITQ